MDKAFLVTDEDVEEAAEYIFLNLHFEQIQDQLQLGCQATKRYEKKEVRI